MGWAGSENPNEKFSRSSVQSFILLPWQRNSQGMPGAPSSSLLATTLMQQLGIEIQVYRAASSWGFWDVIRWAFMGYDGGLWHSLLFLCNMIFIGFSPCDTVVFLCDMVRFDVIQGLFQVT